MRNLNLIFTFLSKFEWTTPLKLLKESNSKTAGATSDLIGNKIADKVTKVSISSPQNSWETVQIKTENIQFGTDIPKERYISPE